MSSSPTAGPSALSTRPAGLIIDLDGTLADSLHDIAGAMNHCLALLGLPGRPEPEYRFLVGEGIENLCRRALPPAEGAYLSRLIELVRTHYRCRCVVHTRPYEGIVAALERLRAANVALAVLSNKPHDMTVRIVARFWPEGYFATVCGHREPLRRKPDPGVARQICDAMRLPPEQVWLVGDTPVDVQTARALGTRCVGVTWGFRPRADLEAAGADFLIAKPAELPAVCGL